MRDRGCPGLSDHRDTIRCLTSQWRRSRALHYGAQLDAETSGVRGHQSRRPLDGVDPRSRPQAGRTATAGTTHADARPEAGERPELRPGRSRRRRFARRRLVAGLPRARLVCVFRPVWRRADPLDEVSKRRSTAASDPPSQGHLPICKAACPPPSAAGVWRPSRCGFVSRLFGFEQGHDS